jgi:peptide/nickel transport system permease protein
MALPALTLGLGLAASVMRRVRSSMLEVLAQDFVTTARAKGLRERTVIRVHALKNAFLPVVTVMGLQISRLLGGAVIIEEIFALPGLGRLGLSAIFTRDFFVVQGTILFVALIVVVVNLFTDMIYGLLDPRIRYL